LLGARGSVSSVPLTDLSPDPATLLAANQALYDAF
jgi:hypothetical protein